MLSYKLRCPRDSPTAPPISGACRHPGTTSILSQRDSVTTSASNGRGRWVWCLGGPAGTAVRREDRGARRPPIRPVPDRSWARISEPGQVIWHPPASRPSGSACARMIPGSRSTTPTEPARSATSASAPPSPTPLRADAVPDPPGLRLPRPEPRARAGAVVQREAPVAASRPPTRSAAYPVLVGTAVARAKQVETGSLVSPLSR